MVTNTNTEIEMSHIHTIDLSSFLQQLPWLQSSPNSYTNTNKSTSTNTNTCKCRNTEMKIWTIEPSILCFLRQLPRLWPCPPYKPYNACWPYNAHTPPASKCLVFPFSTFHISIFSTFHISIFSTFHILNTIDKLYLSLDFSATGMLMVIILSPSHRWGLRGSPLWSCNSAPTPIHNNVALCFTLGNTLP